MSICLLNRTQDIPSLLNVTLRIGELSALRSRRLCSNSEWERLGECVGTGLSGVKSRYGYGDDGENERKNLRRHYIDNSTTLSTCLFLM
jgi:hypothetical protein